MNAIRCVYIGLPAHNEETALPRLLQRIELLGASLQKTITVVLYNDGSTDLTSTIARQWQERLPLVLLDCPQNKGLGAGLRALVQYVVETAHDEDILVIMDCDDTHDPAQVRRDVEVDRGRSRRGNRFPICTRSNRAGRTTIAACHRAWRCCAVQTRSSSARRPRLHVRISQLSCQRSQEGI